MTNLLSTDIQRLKACTTEEERNALALEWNDEDYFWGISVEVDVQRYEACNSNEERQALISGWDARYFEAVFTELGDRLISRMGYAWGFKECEYRWARNIEDSEHLYL